MKPALPNPSWVILLKRIFKMADKYETIKTDYYLANMLIDCLLCGRHCANNCKEYK